MDSSTPTTETNREHQHVRAVMSPKPGVEEGIVRLFGAWIDYSDRIREEFGAQGPVGEFAGIRCHGWYLMAESLISMIRDDCGRLDPDLLEQLIRDTVRTEHLGDLPPEQTPPALDEKKQRIGKGVREIIDVVELSEHNTHIKIRFTLRCEGGADSDRIVEIRKEFNSYFYYPSGHDVAGKTLDFLLKELGPYRRRKRWEAEAKEQPA